MLIKVYNNELSIKDLSRIMQVLRNGGVIIYPTDTVYAFGCDANNREAIERICTLRNKDLKKPSLSIICESISQIREYTLFSDDVFKLLKQYLPGPFTFILEGNSHLPRLFKNRKTVGVRMPDNKVVQQIIEEFGAPLMTASLRTDGNDEIEYLTDPELINEKYEADVDLVLDAGIGGTEPSTIIDCTDAEAVIVRQGVGKI